MELVRCSSLYFLNLWNVSARTVKIGKAMNFELFIILNSENLLKKNGLRLVQEIVSEMVWSFQQ